MIKQSYTLRDIQNISGIDVNTLRVWKSRYGILSDGKMDSGKIRYTSGDLRFMMQVKTLLDSGMKISTILSLDDSERLERIWAKTINRTIHPSDKIESNLLVAILELDQVKLERCYMDILEKHSFSNAMSQVLLPFLKTCGELWQNQSIHVAQEHFISNFIRQKLISATDRLAQPGSNTDLLLFLPEGELHEIPLLYINYLLLESGRGPLYLGSSIPYIDLDDILLHSSFRVAISGWIYSGDAKQQVKQMTEVVEKHPDVTFWLNCPDEDWEPSGSFHLPHRDNLHRFKTADELIERL